MARKVYQNNNVEITSEAQYVYECKININGKNLIWISREQEDDFIAELGEVLDRYRI